MTIRRLRVLLQHLPPESATWTGIRNAMSEEDLAQQAEKSEPEKARWSQLEHLVAAVVDRVAGVEHVLVAANTSKKAKHPKPPEPIRRPGVKPRQTERRISDAQANHLFTLINGGAA